MGTTSRLLLPYPELSDAANVPVDMQELSQRIETVIFAAPVRKTTFFTAQAGWDLSGGNQMDILIGNLCQFYFSAKRTGAAILVPANGDITNANVAALPAGWSLQSWGPMGGGLSGRVAKFGWSGTIIQLAAVSAGSSINTNEVLTCIGSAWFGHP